MCQLQSKKCFKLSHFIEQSASFCGILIVAFPYFLQCVLHHLVVFKYTIDIDVCFTVHLVGLSTHRDGVESPLLTVISYLNFSKTVSLLGEKFIS